MIAHLPRASCPVTYHIYVIGLIYTSTLARKLALQAVSTRRSTTSTRVLHFYTSSPGATFEHKKKMLASGERKHLRQRIHLPGGIQQHDHNSIEMSACLVVMYAMAYKKASQTVWERSFAE